MSKNEVVLTFKSDIIWASGQFLTEPFPDNYEQWSNEKLDDFIDDHKWEPFEDYDPSFIWEQIEHLAYSVRKYIYDQPVSPQFKFKKEDSNA